MTGLPFRDLNRNGTLDPYEDSSRPVEERVSDLLGQMTLSEKAGLMFHDIGVVDPQMAAMMGRSASDAITDKTHHPPERARRLYTD
jgi:hypothetical protein